MGRLWIALGALAAAAAVAASAAAAHALPPDLGAQARAALQSAIQMQAWHAIALILTGLWLARLPPGRAATLANLAGAAFALGLLLFCGAIYVHQLAGVTLGPLAPTGGLLLIAAWLLLALSALRAP